MFMLLFIIESRLLFRKNFKKEKGEKKERGKGDMIVSRSGNPAHCSKSSRGQIMPKFNLSELVGEEVLRPPMHAVCMRLIFCSRS